MKWLIITVVILAQQPTKAPERKGAAQPKVTQSAEQPEKADHGNGQPQSLVSITVNTSLPSPDSDSSKEQAAENMQVQRRLTFYTGLLVVAGFVTAALIWWQARETRRSVQAIRDSMPYQQKAADAALLNAQAVINAERPWMLVEFDWRQTQGLEGIGFYAVNKGETPAEIIEAYFEREILPHISDDLPIPPKYKSPTFIPRRGDMLIVKDEKWDLNPVPIHPESWIDNSMKRDAVETAREFVYFYGVIVYRDMLHDGADPAGQHYTRFCFNYDVFLKALRPSGRNEYRQKQ